jgi:uncharacterized protein YigA (DUF484 family)
MHADNEAENRQDADARRPSAAVVSLRHYRLARQIAETGRRQGELAQLLRAAANDREQLAEALRGAQHRLAGVADNYRLLLRRLDRERTFRDACRAAAELDDLDEMIRRRDELTRQLAMLRRDDACRAAAD